MKFKMLRMRNVLYHAAIGLGRHEKICKMSANQNSEIQMTTYILAKKYAIYKNLISIYDLKLLMSTKFLFYKNLYSIIFSLIYNLQKNQYKELQIQEMKYNHKYPLAHFYVHKHFFREKDSMFWEKSFDIQIQSVINIWAWTLFFLSNDQPLAWTSKLCGVRNFL